MKYVLFLILLGLVLLIFEGARTWWYLSKASAVVAQAQPYTQEGAGRSILVAGESTAYGTGAEDPRDSLAGRLGSAFPDAQIDMAAVNGQKVSELVETLKEVEPTYDLLVIAIGGNDTIARTPQDKLREDMREAWDLGKKVAEDVVVISTGNVGGAEAFGPVTGAWYTWQTRKVRESFLETTEAAGVGYADLYAAGVNEQFAADPDQYYAADGFHPSGAGYGLWFEVLLPVIETETGWNLPDID